MQIFALETNVDRLKQKLFSSEEREVFTVRRHGILFVLRSLWYGTLTLLLIALSLYVIISNLIDPLTISIAIFVLWFVIIFFPWVRAFIDWRYDFIFLTTEKLVIVDQTFIIRRIITSLSLDSIAQVNSHSQWLNLFGFGKLEIAQREGQSENFHLPYLPNVERISTLISDQIATFELRQSSSTSV